MRRKRRRSRSDESAVEDRIEGDGGVLSEEGRGGGGIDVLGRGVEAYRASEDTRLDVGPPNDAEGCMDWELAPMLSRCCSSQ
jgi:hypothetical protein